MKRLFIFWLFLSCVYSGHSQVITITDIETGNPLELVTITSDEYGLSALSNTKGQADISAFAGVDKIEFRVIGYKPIIRSYSLLQNTSWVIQMSPALINLDEIVVSATRWDQKTSEIPSKVISISPGMLSLQNPQTAADMLGISGRVFIQKSQQGGGSPMIRGFATNRLLYSVDGIRMNTAIYRSGNIQNVISLDPFAMEHTEILFSPGSVIYGSDAIGGVMSFQTLTPQFSLSDSTLVTGNAINRYSSANKEKTSHFDINTGWKKWASLTSISSSDFDDLRMGSHGPLDYLRSSWVQRQDSLDVIIENEDPLVQKPSGYSQINIMQKLHYKPGEKWDFHYGFHYSETSQYSRYDRHILYKGGEPRYGEWNYGPQKWMMNNLSINHHAKSTFYDQFTIRLAQQFFEESRISRDFNKPERQIRTEKVNALSANIDFTKYAGSKNRLFYGLEMVHNDVNSNGSNKDIMTSTTSPGPSRYPQSSWASYAVYISSQTKLSERLTIQSGFRYNQYLLRAEFDTSFYAFPFTSASLNKGALTGSLGIVFSLDKSWLISANVSTAFRSPNVDDMGKVFDSEPGAVTVPNPDLKAEYAWNADMSITKIIRESVKIDISGYYTILQNAMVRRDYSLNGMDSIVYDGEMSRIQAIQNAAFARVYGIQAGIDVKLPAGFGFSSDFSYQKGIEELDDGTTSPSRHAPPLFGVSRLTYAGGKLNIQFYSAWSGKKSFEDLPEEEKGKAEIYAKDENGNPWSPAWYTLNFKAVYQLTDRLGISAGLENITDAGYRTYSSGIAAAGRNFILSVKANF